MKTMLVMGIMSGTSMDGVDYAVCRISQKGCKLAHLWKARFPARLQQRLIAAASNRASSYEVAQLHHDLGRFYAQHGTGSKLKAQLAGLHGQTIYHNASRREPATFQIGEPAYLAEKLGITVVSNFRAADIAAGGQGAPLTTMFHVATFGRRGRHVCVNNIGGISNVTSIDLTRAPEADIEAFDTGPGNVLIDLAMRELTQAKLEMDRNGLWAAKGRANEALLANWLQHPFFRRQPPKSTGRELFGEPFFTPAMAQMKRRRLSKYDIVATLTEFAARSIALNYRLHLSIPQQIILTGGGAANPVLAGAIKRDLLKLVPTIRVTTSADHAWPLQAVEPAAFALLAYLRANNQPGNIPSTTGALEPAMLGQVSLP